MKSKVLLIVVLCLALMATTASARSVVTATRLDPSELPMGPGTPVPEDVGNLNAPAFALGGWFTGQESYAAVFDASQQVSCDNGFRVTQVHQYLQFDATQVPVTFEVSATLGSAVWDAAAGCYVPGPMECTGDVYTVTIDAEGLYDINVPIVCECAYLQDPTGAPYQYYVAMNYLTLFPCSVISDGVPASCFTYNDYGFGWEDLAPYFGSYGNVTVFADAECCDNPIPNEKKTWGTIKSLFR